MPTFRCIYAFLFHDNAFSFIIDIFSMSRKISYLDSLIRNNMPDYVIGREHNPYWHQTSNHITKSPMLLLYNIY